MIKRLLENTEYAVENNEMKEFLMGEGKYFIPDRETSLPNYSAHLVSAINKFHEMHPQKHINIIFESTLIELFIGSNFELMSGFEYFFNHKYFYEANECSHFILSKECSVKLKEIITKRKESLKAYKEIWEYGGYLDNGAYEYIENLKSKYEKSVGDSLF